MQRLKPTPLTKVAILGGHRVLYGLLWGENLSATVSKYFISNAPAKTPLLTLLKAAFSRWNVEHVFRVAKTEIGFSHFEGRSWKGLLRHMILCQAVLLFVAEQTDKLRGEKSRVDDGADRAGAEYHLPPLATSSPPWLGA